MDELELEFGKGRRGGATTVTVRAGDRVLQVDEVRLASERERTRFIKSLGHHEGIDPEEIAEHLLTEAVRRRKTADSDESGQSPPARATLPTVILPGKSQSVADSAAQLGELLGATGRFYNRGDILVYVDRKAIDSTTVRPVRAAALPCHLESVARLLRIGRQGDLEPAICTESTARLILHAERFLGVLPPIRVVSRCPVLIERDGRLVQIVDYDRDTGILAQGRPIPEITVQEARERIELLLDDFRFASPADKARAIAALVTPAMVFGGLLGGRAPLDLGEADDSQSGKGYRNKLTAAIYGQQVKTITQRRGGVGSLEETFNSALVGGAGFVSIDNVRGALDSPAIESFLTEDVYFARIPYMSAMEIDSKRVVVMMTSNKAELTIDLANRASCVQIRKQSEGYDFHTFPEGDLLDHVRSHPDAYLGAVFAAIRAWHDQGKPQTSSNDHDFRQWAGTLGWIVENVFDAGPLLEGHRETQIRVANSALNWLRDVALVIERLGCLDRWLRAHEVLDMIADEAEVPGIPEDTDVKSEDGHGSCLRALGRQFKKCFSDHTVHINAFRVERRTVQDDAGRDRKEYRFTRDNLAVTREAPASSRSAPHSRGDSEHPVKEEAVGDHDTDPPLDDPSIPREMLVAPAGNAGNHGISGENRGATREPSRSGVGDTGDTDEHPIGQDAGRLLRGELPPGQTVTTSKDTDWHQPGHGHVTIPAGTKGRLVRDLEQWPMPDAERRALRQTMTRHEGPAAFVWLENRVRVVDRTDLVDPTP